MSDPQDVPTLKDIDDMIARYVRHHRLLHPDEHLNLLAHVLEPVRFTDGRASYRRLCLTDAVAHPGAVESLLRHTTEDLAEDLHPTTAPRAARHVS